MPGGGPTHLRVLENTLLDLHTAASLIQKQAMAVYISVPILDELVQSVKDNPTYKAVNAMACGILSYYFAPSNGYVISPERGRNDHGVDMAIYRIRRRFPDDQNTLDHTLVGVKGSMAPTEQSLDLLEGALENQPLDL
ncbi:hypothetical protein VE01_07291 [Pseudogymnoascus verrucosus]|uniref:Uncharacterized protein n=1 Tax=Pseudogymnoascus verrucosus TaxID=342668 RepID=A0A1B8GFA7_9PEZI|nr:uncharacterized protein VE01_07291 [Pseudogymnoascus verrucosus]OBT94522.2 hypothetical protein VE01_07291 [Pseudogymnoascus verrucosus]